MQAIDWEAGHVLPCGRDTLARLVPDATQYKCVGRLLRQLLHPQFACRPTVQDLLEHEFLNGV